MICRIYVRAVLPIGVFLSNHDVKRKILRVFSLEPLLLSEARAI